MSAKPAIRAEFTGLHLTEKPTAAAFSSLVSSSSSTTDAAAEKSSWQSVNAFIMAAELGSSIYLQRQSRNGARTGDIFFELLPGWLHTLGTSPINIILGAACLYTKCAGEKFLIYSLSIVYTRGVTDDDCLLTCATLALYIIKIHG